MQYKCFSTMVISLTAGFLLAIAATVYVLDPFCHFHLPWFGLEAVFSRGTQSYSNPGLAKNCDYDSVLIGSSVSENFRSSWFDQALDCKTLKLPYAGGSSRTYTEIMKVAFDSRDLRYVFFSVDQFAFQKDASKPQYELPDYLYDKNPFNDVNYLLNKGIFAKIFDMLQYNRSENVIPFDDAYSWQEAYVFSEERVLSQYKQPTQMSPAKPKEYLLANAEANLRNITPFIEAHPDTDFYFFFPPYSILYWEAQKQAGTLDAILEMTGYLMDNLLQYQNVKVFYFQNEQAVIEDLNHYREMMHFSRDINQWMVGCIANGDHQVIPDDVKTVLADMREQALAFDYQGRYGRS